MASKPRISVTYQPDEGRYVATMTRGRKPVRNWGVTRRQAVSRVRRGAGMSGG